MATPKNRDFRSTCLLGTLIVGMGCLGWGSMVHAVLPCDVTQSALTPEERSDELFLTRVWEILQEASLYEAIHWYVAGIALMALSGFGLWSEPKKSKLEPEVAGSDASGIA
jgi:hypothetical protein